MKTQKKASALYALSATALATGLVTGLISLTSFAARADVAVPPGSCDSINQAIASLPASGGTVVLSAGTYTCDLPVVIDRNNVTVRGAGRDKTLIKTADGKAMPTVIIGQAKGMSLLNGMPYPNRLTSNVTLSGVSIDGNYHAHQDPGGFECFNPENGVSLTCGTDPGYFIRNNGLTIRYSQHIRVSDLLTRGGFSGGIVLEKRNDDIQMDNFDTTDNWYDGFAGYETSNSKFSNFRAYNNLYSGLSVDVSFEGNTFINGVASNNGDNGIFSADVGHNTYQNMQVLNNRNLGFYIDGTRTPDHVMIPHTCDGNQIINVVISGLKSGLNVNHACLSTVVKNVQITQPNLACTVFNSAAKISMTGVTCSNGQQSVSLDSQSQL